MSQAQKELFDKLLDIVDSILDNAISTEETLPPHGSYEVDGDLIRQLADVVGKIEEIDTGAQGANYNPETPLSSKEILAQIAILEKQLSEQIKLAVSDTILAEVQKQQRLGGNLAKPTPPTDPLAEANLVSRNALRSIRQKSVAKALDGDNYPPSKIEVCPKCNSIAWEEKD